MERSVLTSATQLQALTARVLGQGGGLSSGQASIKQTLNMFLTELDGFSPSEDGQPSLYRSHCACSF